MRFIPVLVGLAVVIVFVAVIYLPASADDPTHDPPDNPRVPSVPPSPPYKHPKLASSIVQLVQAAQDVFPVTAANISRVQPNAGALLDSGLLNLDDLGRLQVYIHVSANYEHTMSEMESMGVVMERQDDSGTLVQARVHLKDLPGLAGLEYVTAVTPPKYGRVNLGSKLTEGDGLLGFGSLRTTYGLDGTGVTVGVISDGIFGLADAIASGDLPATTFIRDGNGKLVSTSGGVIATSFRADGDLEAGLGVQTGAEGTAILEIVHDIAPGAQLRFANFGTSLEFNAAVDFLAANSDVVIDDIAFFKMPYDQTSPVSANTSAELNRPSNPIRGYYAAVGNHALRHYQEAYVDSGTDGTLLVGQAGNFHHFNATSGTTDRLGLGPRIANVMLLRPGETAVIVLTWDDVFGATTTDYDLYVSDNNTGAVVAASFNDNTGVTLEPTEAVGFTNVTASSKFYDIFIQNWQNGSAAKTFDMFVLSGGFPCSNGTIMNYNTIASSVPAQSDAGGGVISVGAINASDPGIDDIEPFSSRGPTNNGAIKPDVAAIDGVSVTGVGGFSSTFFGTSAAAPHVAGLAALLLDLRPDLLGGESGDDPAADRAALRSAIIGTAVDLGVAGVDNTFGHGRANGPASGVSVAPTPTPTPTPIPTASDWGLMAMGIVFGLLIVYRIRRRIHPSQARERS